MFPNNLIKILKFYGAKMKMFFLSKDVFIFLFFLVLSTGFWFINALSKPREKTIEVPLQYEGLPPDIVITNSPPKFISLKIRDEGRNLLSYTRKKLNPLIIQLARNFQENGEIIISTDQFLNKFTYYLQPTTLILEAKPETILIRYEKLYSKVLPVECKINFDLLPQYMISDEIKLQPSKVNVFGPKHLLDSLKTIKTELIYLKSLHDTTIITAKLQSIANVRFLPEIVEVIIPVEMFTEKKVQLPITVINAPGDIYLRTLPSKVIATFNIAMSRYHSFKPSDIQVAVDYNEVKNNNSDKLNVKILRYPIYVKNIRLDPQQVDFFVEKNK